MSKVKIIDRRSEVSIMSERNLLSKIRHPFIVNMYFAFQDFYNLYLVMDLLTGGDLRYHIAHKKTFSEKQTKFIISNMLLALEYIHSKNIIHRDIKPENLVLENNGYVRITDFGVAKINEIDNSSETSGTPGYMAPEVILVQNHTFVSDFFALGVIGYEFMLGYRPYLGRGRKEIKQLIISKQAKLVESDIPDDWSKESMDFINKLLQRKPKKRLGYNGVVEIKEHPWMNDVNWDLLMKKKIEAPFIPSAKKENFDKRYCEGNDRVGEETIERYELYLQSDLYEDVFVNYTYINLDYITKHDNSKKQKFRLNSSDGFQNDKNNYQTNISNNKNKFVTSNKQEKLINKNINICNNDSKKDLLKQNQTNSSVKNSNNNSNRSNNEKNKIIKNKSNVNTIDYNTYKNNNSQKEIEKKQEPKKSLLSSHYNKYSSSDHITKYNTPMVNENIMCNNYINLNFNNCANLANQQNKNNEAVNKLIDVSTIKQILNNHISNENNNNNNIDDKTQKRPESKNREKISVNINKNNANKYTLSKSSSMKVIEGYHNNFLIDNKSPILKEKFNKNNNLFSNNNNLKPKQMQNINSNQYSVKNYFSNNMQPNKKILKTNNKITKANSEYNLKIDTNDLNSITSQHHQKHKNRSAEKSFMKTTSCDRFIMNNNYNNYNNFNPSKKTIQRNAESNSNFDKKLMFWIKNNFKNNKPKKNIYKPNNINEGIMSKYSTHSSLVNIKNNDSKNKIKNKKFPCINCSNSPIKQIFELNTINTNSRQIKNNVCSNRENFNTINSTSALNKVQSLKNIHKNKNSKIHNLFNVNSTSSQFFFGYNSNANRTAQRNKKNSIKNRFSSNKGLSSKRSTEDIFGKTNYRTNNLKINYNEKRIGSNLNKNQKMGLEYIKSI